MRGDRGPQAGAAGADHEDVRGVGPHLGHTASVRSRLARNQGMRWAGFTPPADPDGAIAAVVGMTWATGCTAKFVWLQLAACVRPDA